jgi:hypothetical protein
VLMPMNYITLTRQELNDIAWAKPMNNLAKEFRIAEVGPAKRCRAVDVPHPIPRLFGPQSRERGPTPHATAQIPHPRSSGRSRYGSCKVAHG